MSLSDWWKIVPAKSDWSAIVIFDPDWLGPSVADPELWLQPELWLHNTGAKLCRSISE